MQPSRVKTLKLRAPCSRISAQRKAGSLFLGGDVLARGCAGMCESAEHIFDGFDDPAAMSANIEAALDYVSQQLQQLSSYGPRALTCVALAAVSTPSIRWDILIATCQAIGEKGLRHVSPKSLTRLCWVLACAAHRDGAMLAAIGEELAERAPDFTSEDLVRCLYAYSELKVCHEAMLASVTVELMWRIDQLTAGNLAQLAVALARLEYCKQPMFEWLGSCICRRPERSLNDVSSVVWAFAKAGIQHEQLCQVAAHAASSADACTLSEEQHARLMWAFGKPNLGAPAVGIPRPLFLPKLANVQLVLNPEPATEGA